MKSKTLLLLPLLAALALCGCVTVMSKKPVGDKVTELKPEDWNGKWQDWDGAIYVTKIKDATAGIVELTVIKPKAEPDEAKANMPDALKQLLAAPVLPGTKGLLDTAIGPAIPPSEKPDEPQALDFFVRTMDGHVIASAHRGKPGEPYGFLRIVINSNYLLVFMPDTHTFADLIKRGKIAGTISKGGNGREQEGSSLVESLSEQDYARLKKAGVEPRTLFEEDPAAVLFRVSPGSH